MEHDTAATDEATGKATAATPPPGPSAGAADAADAAARGVQNKAVAGVKSLGVRTLLSIGLGLISSLALSHLLDKRDYGIFGFAVTFAQIGTYFTDGGMATVLIKQEHAPTDDETTSAFWAQQAVTVVVLVVSLLLLPLIVSINRLSGQASAVLLVMLVTLFLWSLRIIPMVVLERSFRYDQIARCDMIENVVMVAVNIVLAWRGYGPWSLALGNLIGRFVGLVLIWHASPWVPRGRFRPEIVKHLLKGGIPIHANALVPVLMTSVAPSLLTRNHGVEGLGLVNWASALASVPRRFVDVMNRVALPTLSRLQGEGGRMGQSAVTAARRVGTVIASGVPLLVFAAPVFLPLIFNPKWRPAVPLFQWFVMELSLVTAIGILAQTLTVAGRADYRFRLVIFMGLLRWGFWYAAATHGGLVVYAGVVYALTLIECLLIAEAVRRIVPGCERVWRDLMPNLLMPAAATALAYGAATLATVSLAGAGRDIARLALGVVLYLGLIAIWEFSRKPRPFLGELASLVRMLRPAAQ